MTPPDQYKPSKPNELIGPSAGVAAALLRFLGTLNGTSTVRYLFFGDYGCGKSCIASMLARALAVNAIDVEKINGKNLTIDTVREWQRGMAYSSLFGGWKVKLIEEVDLVPPAAQEVMLTYLDDLPAHTGILATSNRSMETLTERFATRFIPVKVDSPSDEEIAALIVKKWKIPKAAANFIAAGSCGNVRDALLRTTNFLITGDVTERPKLATATTLAQKARLSTARNAWLQLQ